MTVKIENFSNFNNKLKLNLKDLENEVFIEKQEHLSPNRRMIEKKFFHFIKINSSSDAVIMLNEHPDLINVKDKKGNTAIIIAAARSIIKYLN